MWITTGIASGVFILFLWTRDGIEERGGGEENQLIEWMDGRMDGYL